ncbi:MAG: hypothetical protein DRJ01_13580 [Bacteroidetes bacterium]|nr:MAG: hypothetical protein DRJ01_13580 [Bacteroidota bacterium]
MEKTKPTYKELEEKIFSLEKKLNKKHETKTLLNYNLYDNLNLGVVIYEVIDNGRDFIFKYLNKEAEKIFNKKINDLIGKSIFEVHPNVENSGLINLFRKALKTEEPIFNPINQYNDNIFSLSYSNFVYKSPSGKIISIFNDLTEKEKNKKALQESEERLKNFINHSPDIIYKYSIKRGFLFLSERVYKLLEYSHEEIKNNPFILKECIHPDDKPTVKKALENRLIGEGFSIEYRLKTKSGKWLWLHDYFMHKTYIDDEIIIEGQVSDFTKKRETEQALKESNETKDKFLSIVAHDLINPFNSMLGFSRLLCENFEEFDTEKQKNYLGIINQDLKKTYNLLENLLHWSSLQRGTISFKSGKENLHQIIVKTIELTTQSAVNKSISISNKVPKNIFVTVDENMFSVVLRNLLSNAIKFTSKGGQIVINAESNKKFVQISVKDNGVGILPEKQLNLFNLTNTASTLGTEQEAGTGLGLILCKEFVEKHRGEIWVKSEVDKGSEFFFTIPTTCLTLQKN